MQGAGFFGGGGTGEGMRRSLRCLGRWGTRLRPGGAAQIATWAAKSAWDADSNVGRVPGACWGRAGQGANSYKGRKQCAFPARDWRHEVCAVLSPYLHPPDRDRHGPRCPLTIRWSAAEHFQHAARVPGRPGTLTRLTIDGLDG